MPHAVRPTRPSRYDPPRVWHDGKAPDGFLINGWRRITKGGYVRFGRCNHYHPRFRDWVGLWVFVELDDCWGVNVNVWPDEPWKDSRTMLACSNEKAWFSDDPVGAAKASRRRPERVCN